METLTATCHSFTRLPSPFEKSHNIKNYYAYVKAEDFFNLDNWRKTNVRDPKPTGRIPDAIWASLNQNPLFCFINRGIIVSAADAKYDNQTNTIQLFFTNPAIHGLLDGGHTYLQIKKFKEMIEERQLEQQVIKIEILVGLGKEELVDIADGRNTSSQVKAVSLDELQDLFEDIKQAIKGQPYEKKIAFKEYETFEDDPTKPKTTSILEILRCIACLDRENFDDVKHPTQLLMRGGDGKLLEYYEKNREQLKALLPLLPDMLILWDTIKSKFRDMYTQTGGKAGAIGPDEKNKIFKPTPRKVKLLPFNNEKPSFVFVDNIRLPIFAAFRAALKPGKNRYTWKYDINPTDFFVSVTGPKLTKVLCDSLKKTQEVSKTVRDESVWESCYDKLRLDLTEAYAGVAV